MLLVVSSRMREGRRKEEAQQRGGVSKPTAEGKSVPEGAGPGGWGKAQGRLEDTAKSMGTISGRFLDSRSRRSRAHQVQEDHGPRSGES